MDNLDHIKNKLRDNVEAAAQRVLDGKGTPADVEAVALWAKHASAWVRTLAAREGK